MILLHSSLLGLRIELTPCVHRTKDGVNDSNERDEEKENKYLICECSGGTWFVVVGAGT